MTFCDEGHALERKSGNRAAVQPQHDTTGSHPTTILTSFWA